MLYVEGLAGRKWRSPVAAIEVQFFAVDAFVAFDLLLDNVADARNSVRDARDEPKQFMRMERMSVQRDSCSKIFTGVSRLPFKRQG